MSNKYRRKPIILEAMQWTGKNTNEIIDFTKNNVLIFDYSSFVELHIKTLEGVHIASVGDYIIRGIHGEYYSCKPGIFTEIYEKVEAAE